MIGLQRGTVKLLPYDEKWSALYAEEKSVLLDAIGNYIIAIEHVGSTSIPGVCAKPIIDIAIGVKDSLNGTFCVSPLVKIGYEYKGEAGVPDRHFFVKGSEKCRTHYLHIEELNGVNWKNHVLFRDYLRNHRKEASNYSNLKRGLAEKYGNDRDAYAKRKNPFIEKIIKAANKIYVFDKSGKTKMI